MLNGINEATSILLEEEEDIQKAFKSALRIIGLAIEVDRVYIFRNHENERKEMLVSQICEWTKDTVSQQIYNPELQNFSYFKNGFARW